MARGLALNIGLNRVDPGHYQGWDGELVNLRDGWHGPIGLSLEARAAPRLHVILEGGFRSFLGPLHDLRERTLAITLAWRP